MSVDYGVGVHVVKKHPPPTIATIILCVTLRQIRVSSLGIFMQASLMLQE